jgi:CheY-like chemotaxis protein
MEKLTVLLVEDNPLTRSSTEEMLVMIGCQVIAAENGQEALTMYRDRLDKINLVISDIVMPGMNGLELYENLQEIAPQLKFLVLTGYPLNEQARTLLEQGHIDWIQKPYQIEEIAAKIGSLIGATLESD